MRDVVGRRKAEAEEALRQAAPQAAPDLDFTYLAEGSAAWQESDEFRRRWRARELAPDEIADLNDLFRRWIDKVVVVPALRRGRPPAGEDDTPRRATIIWRG